MADPKADFNHNDQAQPLSGEPSPEELEAAQAANEHGALADLQGQLHELTLKNAELGELYLRAQADMQNTRRRAEEDVAKSRKFAVESFADAMLPVLDSLEAGLAIKEATPQQIREGAELTLRQLKAALERNKVMEINPAQGARFDPHQHQAISVVPLPAGSTQDANTIVAVLQKGYSIAERTLRPALVTVSGSR
ncbi:nucleotide exchange factor GrpE [Caenimonas koreensis]|uniref:Protein GrpE n=1 Tax=Caenimonas koreensis DSM 17982 TaxID=1121255 RepID=A0A844BC51_9BURK|nr:nucleotide exchange factor GrpE [Caenimonas koreensis]MRD49146.1 nucleotide exchange factor GrpE [Caenimonas koreensis DSM 17982]